MKIFLLEKRRRQRYEILSFIVTVEESCYVYLNDVEN